MPGPLASAPWPYNPTAPLPGAKGGLPAPTPGNVNIAAANDPWPPKWTKPVKGKSAALLPKLLGKASGPLAVYFAAGDFVDALFPNGMAYSVAKAFGWSIDASCIGCGPTLNTLYRSNVGCGGCTITSVTGYSSSTSIFSTLVTNIREIAQYSPGSVYGTVRLYVRNATGPHFYREPGVWPAPDIMPDPFPEFGPQPGTSPVPNIMPEVMPVLTPISPSPLPFHAPRPMELPGAEPSYQPRKWPPPRPRPRPRPETSPQPGVVVVPNPNPDLPPDVSITPQPGPVAGPRARTRPLFKGKANPYRAGAKSPPKHSNKPPKKHHRETKTKGNGATQFAKGVANAVTEGLDANDALWKALPAGGGWQTKVPGKATTPQQKAKDIWNAIGDPDFDVPAWMAQSTVELAKAQAVDVAFGALGKTQAKSARAAFKGTGLGPHGDLPIGWTTGKAFDAPPPVTAEDVHKHNGDWE